MMGEFMTFNDDDDDDADDDNTTALLTMLKKYLFYVKCFSISNIGSLFDWIF